jgi:tetratricopeptide (TPR) repeat protein
MPVRSAKNNSAANARNLAEEAWKLRRTDPQQSLELGERALAQARQENDRIALSQSYQVMGMALHQLSRFVEALDNLQKALLLFEELHDHTNTATTLRSIGGTMIDLGEYAEALKILLRASDMATQASDAGEKIACLMNIASIYGVRNEPSQALDVYAEAETLAQHHNLSYELGIIYRNMGVNTCRLGDNHRAVALLRKALALSHQLKNRSLVAGCLESLGSVFARMDCEEKALRYYIAALRIQKESPPGLSMAVTLFNIGTILDNTGKPDEALAYSLEALHIAEAIDAKKFTCDMHRRCALLYEERDDTANACHHLKKCLELTQKLSATEQQKTLSLYQVRFEVERNRTRQEELQRRLREAEYTALRAQMNPHFISNALNAIQSFIIEGENEEAQRYLSLFARLVRRSFEQTRLQYIPLEEELMTLQLYLDIEKMRFERGFEYTISVDSSLDPALISVPPMLLQPFAENSIIHGILPAHRPGMLLITATLLPDNILRYIVEDNGIGLMAAAVYSHQRYNKKNRSLGLTLVRERLALLEEISGHATLLTITERGTTQGSGGTIVELQIPVLLSPREYM